MVQVRVEIRLKRGVTDPEGDNVQKALNLLGFKGVQSVRSSKLFLIDLRTKDAGAARKEVEEMCRRLLANPVIHDYAIAIEKGDSCGPSAPKDVQAYPRIGPRRTGPCSGSA